MAAHINRGYYHQKTQKPSAPKSPWGDLNPEELHQVFNRPVEALFSPERQVRQIGRMIIYMKRIYCIIAMCLSLCFIISCGGDTNEEDVVDGPGAVPNIVLAEVISIYDDYLIAIVTAGDSNFSPDDQINIYFNDTPCTEAIQVGDTIEVGYWDNDFSKTDGVFSINVDVIEIVLDQNGEIVIISLLTDIKAEVVSIYNDYLIAVVTSGDDNFSQDDQIDIYFDVYSIPGIEVGGTILASYCINDFSKTDGAYSINAHGIGIVNDQ